LAPFVFLQAPRMAVMVLFGLIAGIILDLDLLAGSFLGVFSLHQGATHSIFAAAVLALLLALLFKLALSKLRAKKETVKVVDGLARISRLDEWNLLQVFLAAFLGAIFHIYLSCMAGFAVPLFWPFSGSMFSAPAIFAVDPLLTLPLLVLLFRCLRHFKDKARLAEQVKWARCGFAWALLYPLACLGIQAGLSYKYNRDYTEVGTTVEKISVTPVLSSPFYWKAIAENNEEYRMVWVGGFRLLQRPYFDLPAYPKANPRLWKGLTEKVPVFEEYKNCVRFPVMEMGEGDRGFREYIFKDLRWAYAVPGFIQFLMDDPETPCALRALLDEEGRAHAWRWQDCGSEKPGPWMALRPIINILR
jgi:membrane-bound metal-dependent hydrolase YbcI (DUF457 family)